LNVPAAVRQRRMSKSLGGAGSGGAVSVLNRLRQRKSIRSANKLITASGNGKRYQTRQRLRARKTAAISPSRKLATITLPWCRLLRRYRSSACRDTAPVCSERAVQSACDQEAIFMSASDRKVARISPHASSPAMHPYRKPLNQRYTSASGSIGNSHGAAKNATPLFIFPPSPRSLTNCICSAMTVARKSEKPTFRKYQTADRRARVRVTVELSKATCHVATLQILPHHGAENGRDGRVIVLTPPPACRWRR
jgi:hypothetical protein